MSDLLVLHPLEKTVLFSLSDYQWRSFDQIVNETKLNPDQVRRALEWLLSKKFVEQKEIERKMDVTVNSYPAELKLVEILNERGGEVELFALKEMLSQDEISAGIGKAKSLSMISIESGERKTIVKVVDKSKYIELKEYFEKIKHGKIPKEKGEYFEELRQRGIIEVNERVSFAYRITQSGKNMLSEVKEEYVDSITTEFILSRQWDKKKIRPIDVSTEAPRLYSGRRHPVKEFIREVREVYLSMGFTELQGSSVQPAFWNFDALFIPQDHPAREMQDTFYLSGFYDKKIKREGVYEKVALTHENGWKTGSKGWQYVWDINEARKLILRTHNTVLTVKALSEFGNRELRVFAVSKVYRNENLDYKHLAEFHQMDGIIEGKGLNVSHLIGFLKEFYKKLGIPDIKLWPTYFPYTEPSLQIMGYSTKTKGWIELGGSGIFRPEVTIPLGVTNPVLAWGPAIERLMLLRYDLDDIRELYSNNISWLRGRKQYARS